MKETGADGRSMDDRADGSPDQELEPGTEPGMEELDERLEKLREAEAKLEVELEGDGSGEALPPADEGPQLKLESSTRMPKVSEPPAEFPPKVLIIGSARGWEVAPFADTSWSVWSLSRMYHSLPRWDVWFELHPWDRLCERLDGATPQHDQVRMRAEYQQWLSQDHGRPIFMQRQYPQVPGCVEYPLHHILDTFPQRYFTNSVSYMIALAVFQGAREIAIYGVDMATKEEYTAQRSGVEYWVGLAQGAGVDVHIPDHSDLCKARVLYGFHDDPMHDKLNQKLDTALRSIKEAEQMERQAALALANARGAKQILEWQLRNY